MPNLHTLDTGQGFPLYLYTEPVDEDEQAESPITDIPALLEPIKGESESVVTPSLMMVWRTLHAVYPNEAISKEDVFYYVYGLLHSPDYRERYADNLSKELPRIPCVNTAAVFWVFSKAGRKLADLHLNFETVEKYPLKIVGGGSLLADVITGCREDALWQERQGQRPKHANLA